jgi:predicted phosphodiesterase
VARIPEEASLTDDAWHAWGRSLQQVLCRLCPTPHAWLSFIQALEHHPLHEAFLERRAALIAGLMSDNAAARRTTARRKSRGLVCVLADVHANAPALDAVLVAAERDGVDQYLFVGDAVGYGPHPAECVRRLAELPNAIHVRGNHDNAIGSGHWESGANSLARDAAAYTVDALDASALSWLRSLPIEHREGDWLAVHGAPKDPSRFLAYVYELTYEENMQVVCDAGLSLCFHGHTHVQLAHRRVLGHAEKLGAPPCLDCDPKRPMLVNPGSVGQPRDGSYEAAFAIWDRREAKIHLRRVSYDLDKTLGDLRRAGLSAALGERLRLGR